MNLLPDKYGLVNQGATCYLNSVLQVLYMTEDFRAAVDRHACENPDTECIDRHLQALFDDLKGKPAYTYDVTRKLGIDRVNEPRDAAEYFEKILGLTSPTASEIFHGLLTHKTICSTCSRETYADGAFWHLPLALVDSSSQHYSVVEGIEDYFRASDCSGENQMYCDQCDAKSDATIECVMKRHPEVLMLLLKRFEFDYRYMTYVKNNSTVEVPRTLQIPENQTYELYAVVDHFGDLRNGHYTAMIEDEGGWYIFNDSSVALSHYQPFQVENSEISSSVYLLFYRKQDDCREVSTPAGFPSTISDDVHHPCPDALEMRERQGVEGAEEAGRDSAVTVSSNGNEETGIEDIVNGKHAIQDVMSGAQRSVKTDKDGKTADVEQSGNKQKYSLKYLKEHKEHEDNEELNKTQDVGEDYGLRSVSVDKQGGEERVEINLEVDEEGKTGADERGMESERGKLGFRDNRKVGYSQQKHIQNSRRSLTENQGVESVEKTSQGDSQPKPCPEFNKDTVEGRRGSKPRRIVYAIISEEEFSRPSNIKISSETRYIKIETSEDGTNSLVEVNEEDVKRKPDPKTDAKVTSSSGFCDLNLSESSSPESQKHKLDLGPAQEGKETNGVVCLDNSFRKMQKVLDTQAAGIQYAKKKKNT